VSAREHVFMLQNCASECVNNGTYRTLQETCDEGALCSSGQGSEALIGSLDFQAVPTNRQMTRTTGYCGSGNIGPEGLGEFS